MRTGRQRGGCARQRLSVLPAPPWLSRSCTPSRIPNACLGILRLERAWSAERVEAACQRGIDIGARSYSSIVSILRNNLDRAYRPQPVLDEPPVQHGNIRGGRYYH
jgi:hypothetical protein